MKATITVHIESNLLEQVESLKARTGMSRDRILGEALKNYVEAKTMKRYDGWSISTGFLEGNLFSDTNGIDVHASSAKYAETIREALEKEFPGAEIKVDYQENTEGALPCTLETSAYHDDDEKEFAEANSICEKVDQICSKAWEDFDSWIVNADEN